MLILNT